MYQARVPKLRNGVGALTHDTAVPDHLRAGELGQAPSSAGSVWRPVSVGFFGGLAALALALAIAATVIAVADGDVFIISLVPGPLAATVIAAAVLLPVRGRLQRRVDQLFFGDRGAPYAAMARLGRQVEEATTAEPVLSSVVTVVAGSLRLPYVAVELRVGDVWVPGAAWGQPRQGGRLPPDVSAGNGRSAAGRPARGRGAAES